MVRRSRRLAGALQTLGIQQNDRVATLGWNHYQHLELYFAIPSVGAILHTLNPHLHASDLAYIIGHAGDRCLFVDANLLPLVEQLRGSVKLDNVVVMLDGGSGSAGRYLDYETVLDGGTVEPSFPDIQRA